MNVRCQPALGQDPMLLAWRLASSGCQRQAPSFLKGQVQVWGLPGQGIWTSQLPISRSRVGHSQARIGLPWGGEAEQSVPPS